MIKTSTPKNVASNAHSCTPSKMVLSNIINYSQSLEVITINNSATPLLVTLN